MINSPTIQELPQTTIFTGQPANSITNFARPRLPRPPRVTSEEIRPKITELVEQTISPSKEILTSSEQTPNSDQNSMRALFFTGIRGALNKITPFGKNEKANEPTSLEKSFAIEIKRRNNRNFMELELGSHADRKNSNVNYK